ncbi:synthetase [Nakamurella silvestris]|nr:synthetase [Nakamurella silvestris]
MGTVSGIPWLGGSIDDPAVTFYGRTRTYGQLAERIRATTLSGDGPVRATDPDPLVTLTRLYAAMAAGRPAIVSDPARAPVRTGELPADTFLVAVTSGSAGKPRAVARTARSWSDSFAPLAELTGLTGTDKVLLTGPLHATLHLFAAVHTLWLGAHLTDERRHATAVHCVPSVLGELLDQGFAPRRAVVAGAALPEAKAAGALAAGIDIVEYYGATELSFVAARRAPNRLRPFPGVEVDVRHGVLWARSPYLASGYVGDHPGPLRVADDGFATVGDLAGTTPDGGIIIRGRADAAINTGGSTVIAEDVEAALMTQPGVVAAAVIGEDHPRFGATVTAVLEVSAEADPVAIKAGARRLLGTDSVPRRWLLTDALPRTTTGKIARGLVASSVADGTLPTRPLA